LGDSGAARRYFDELVNRFPDSTQVRELRAVVAP